MKLNNFLNKLKAEGEEGVSKKKEGILNKINKQGNAYLALESKLYTYPDLLKEKNLNLKSYY